MSSFNHLNQKNNPTMVNVSDKKITKRTAIAKASMFLGTEVISHFTNDELITKKGPVFQTAIIAGIQAVKKTSELIPMCHPLLINGVDIDINIVDDKHIDCKVYLPVDLPWMVKKCLKVVQPKKLILAAYDVWPNLIWKAKSMGIHSTLFAARFSENTSKLFPGVRNFYRSVYGCFSAIYTISTLDHERLQHILYPTGQPIVRVLGNPRYDQVKQKSDQFTSERTESVLLRPKRLLAGSIHSEDKQVIQGSIMSLMNEIEDLYLVWVPHEPTERNVSEAESFFQSNHFSTVRLGNKNPNQLDARVIIVDTIGRLSQLYWDGQMAYIGGGFSTGVHNVMEPAIARLPVFFGPRYKNFNEAEELITDGGGFSIESGTDLYLGMKQLFEDRDAFLKASYAATNVIHRNLGSATRIVRNLIHD